MKKFIIILFIGFGFFANAQNTLIGKVTNTKNQPLSGVDVYITELGKGTSTDENGNYKLTDLPNQQVNVTIAFLGYGTQNKTINLSEKENTLNVTLTDNIYKMDEIVISTPFNKLQSQNVMKVEHASISSLAQKGVATLIQGLATIPGVSQISTGTSIGKPVIRGLSGNRVLVYSQGVRLENQQFGDEHGLGLNDAGIESVEVIKGPASLLYGSDAIGGVLYFNPENFADANTFSGDFEQKYFSNTLGSSSSLGLKTSTNKWKYLARGTYDAHSDYKIPDGKRVTNTRYNETDFKAGIGYNNAKFSSILRYNFNKLDIGIPDNGIAEQSTSKETTFPRQGVFNHLLSLNNIFFFKNSKLDLDFGYIANDRSEFQDSNIAVLHMKLHTFSYNSKFHLPKFGKLESIVGVQGMHQTNENYGEEYLIPNATTNDFGIFGTTNYDWKSNVIQAGIRFDNRGVTTSEHGIIGTEGYFAPVNKSFNSFNASLGYKTDLDSKLTLRINLATGFRAPNLAELTSNGVHEGTYRYEVGNNNLNTEQNIQSDFNLDFKSTHFDFFVNGFYNHVNNYIYTSPSNKTINGYAVYDYVQNNAELYGGEAGIHIHPHPLDWLHIQSNFETVTGKKQNGDYLPLIPANNWNNTIKVALKDKKWFTNGYASLNISTTFNQNNVSGYETSSKGYTLVNAGISGNVKLGKMAFNVNLNGNNLFNTTYIPHLSRLKDEGIPNIGRNIVASLKFNL